MTPGNSRSFKILIDACYSATWLPPLEKIGNVLAVAVAANANEPAWGAFVTDDPKQTPQPGAFTWGGTKGLLHWATTPAAVAATGPSLAKGILFAYQPNNDLDAVIGLTHPPQPFDGTSVHAQLLPQPPPPAPACPAMNAWYQNNDPKFCRPAPGMVSVDLSVAFALDGSGTITVSPPGLTISSSAPPPSFGSPASGDVFFYVTPGTTVTLTANHGSNSYFDAWQVQNGGSCTAPNGIPSGHVGGGSPAGCSFVVEDPNDLRIYGYDARAFFGKCPPPGTHNARQGAAIDCPGVTASRDMSTYPRTPAMATGMSSPGAHWAGHGIRVHARRAPRGS